MNADQLIRMARRAESIWTLAFQEPERFRAELPALPRQLGAEGHPPEAVAKLMRTAFESAGLPHLQIVDAARTGAAAAREGGRHG